MEMSRGIPACPALAEGSIFKEKNRLRLTLRQALGWFLERKQVMKDQEPSYQTQQFATRAGVTVRTLHHYDRLGLLKPSAYTGTGYRLYRESDLARLQQIVTLKYIGFSLQEIKTLLAQNGRDLAAALRRQRKIINQKRHHLGMAVQAIEKAELVI